MLKIRSSEVSDLQASMCFAILPALNSPVYNREHELTVLVAGGKCSTGLSEGFCCPGSPDLCVSKVVDCGLSSFWLLVTGVARLPWVRAGTFMSWGNFGANFVLVANMFQVFLQVISKK